MKEPAPAPKPRLLEQVRHTVRTLHYSYRTEEAYVGWIRRFILFHGKRHPADMGESEINLFLSHLAVNEHLSASTQNQALNAILFLYKKVLDREIGSLAKVVRARSPKRLPVVLTREEIKAILRTLDGIKWIIAALLYGSGLRLMECLRLRVKDLDFSCNQILVREGKGCKDRYTMLPSMVRGRLAEHLKKVRKLHQADLAEGFGRVYLPHALERKYPNASLEWGGNTFSPPQSSPLTRGPAR